ncbi:MAG: chemotaxis protein CheX [Deltaproteobacteria bacterium]|nr:chemotaxis protein CheX [Deltaproteobacteria bacterium]
MEKIQEIMGISIFEVFEKMFYIFLEPSDVMCDDYNVEADILFDGPVSGSVRILFSLDIANAMIQNMLGLENDEITEQDTEDCLKEAVNMVCGNLFGKFDSTEVFNLSVPTFTRQPESLEVGATTHRMDFDSEDGKVGVIIALSH